jgi:hypothetical protein
MRRDASGRPLYLGWAWNPQGLPYGAKPPYFVYGPLQYEGHPDFLVPGYFPPGDPRGHGGGIPVEQAPPDFGTRPASPVVPAPTSTGRPADTPARVVSEAPVEEVVEAEPASKARPTWKPFKLLSRKLGVTKSAEQE